MAGEINVGRLVVAKVAISDATPYYDKLYSYLAPAGWPVFAGGIVLIPFGRGQARPRLGVVVELESPAEADPRLKALLDAAPEEAALSEEGLALVRHLKEVTFCTWWEAVKAVLPRGAQYKIEKRNGAWAIEKKLARADERVYSPTGAPPPALTAKQRAVLDFVGEGAKSRAEIVAGCAVGPGVADTLVKKGLLALGLRGREAPPEELLLGGPVLPAHYELTPAQAKAAGELAAAMESPNPKPALLYGVTGSGKTPVFIHLAQIALNRGKSVLVLVPEIGLTPQMMGALRGAFGTAVAVLHSGLSATQRLAQWRAARDGAASVVVGTRSAVFAPLENIGLIVVDEEQERSYQSETAPRYDAVELARRRAARHGALLLMASATPSVASYHAAMQGRYSLHRLAQRYGNMPLPVVEMVDMGAELLAGNAGAVSRALAEALGETVAAGGQAILLLNRRGYHRVALCRACGKSVKCGDCSVPMVLHREGEAGGEYLLCHHCGQSRSPAPAACPECGGQLRYAGFGTQRLEEELDGLLPGARVLRMDMDTTQRKGAHARMLARFAAGEYDVLLGTQMVAKGLDFERVRLVGVVGIDSLLFAQSYRAYETVFSLVTQVVGRSGRAAKGGGGVPGRAIIQTVDPQNPVLRQAAAQDYEAFYAEEIGFRKLALYPPLCALCVAGFAAQDAAEALAGAKAFAALLARRAQEAPDVPLRVLGPSPMPLWQLAGRYRYRLTLKCRADEAFRRLARCVLADYNEQGWPRRAAVWLDFNSEG